jgi:purine-binding chemotaxis protein CheW
VDLAVRFGQVPQEISRRTCIVILDVVVEGETTVVGILVDSVSQVIDLRDEEIEDAPSFGTKARVEELIGVAPLGKKFALILDVDRVLSSSEAAVATSMTLPAAEAPTGESGAAERSE